MVKNQLRVDNIIRNKDTNVWCFFNYNFLNLTIAKSMCELFSEVELRFLPSRGAKTITS